jgi:hypothetical protein
MSDPLRKLSGHDPSNGFEESGRMLDLTGKDITLCPVCRKGTLVPIPEFPNIRKTDKHLTAFAFG